MMVSSIEQLGLQQTAGSPVKKKAGTICAYTRLDDQPRDFFGTGIMIVAFRHLGMTVVLSCSAFPARMKAMSLPRVPSEECINCQATGQQRATNNEERMLQHYSLSESPKKL